jgi:hypothetical protein
MNTIVVVRGHARGHEGVNLALCEVDVDGLAEGRVGRAFVCSAG